MNNFLLILFAIFSYSNLLADPKPRVFVFTDINIDAGDPDDRQSLVHLLWYADELEIEGIVPDRLDYGGYKACEMVLEAYEADFMRFDLEKEGYMPPHIIADRVARSRADGKERFHEAASREDSPLYVLIWGNMNSFRDGCPARKTHPL